MPFLSSRLVLVQLRPTDAIEVFALDLDLLPSRQNIHPRYVCVDFCFTLNNDDPAPDSANQHSHDARFLLHR